MPLRRAGKKMRAPLLGLAKSIYHMGVRRYGISLRVFNSIAHEWHGRSERVR